MKIDYMYMDPDAVKKTYLLCRARGNHDEAERCKQALIARGYAIPDDKGNIRFTRKSNG